MSDKLTEAKQARFLSRCLETIQQAPLVVSQLKIILQDCSANWSGYALIEDDQEALVASGNTFGSETASAWAQSKPDLEMVLDVLAAGMGTDRNTLCESMKV